MAFTVDEVAGVADLFGALPRTDLERGLVELAFRRGEDFDEAAAADAVEDAEAAYALVATGSDPELLAPGPAAFPALPDGAADLPHILDVERRSTDRAELAAAAERRFRADLAAATDADDEARLRELLEVCFDLDAWGPVDVGDCREEIEARL